MDGWASVREACRSSAAVFERRFPQTIATGLEMAQRASGWAHCCWPASRRAQLLLLLVGCSSRWALASRSFVSLKGTDKASRMIDKDQGFARDRPRRKAPRSL